MIVAFVAVEEVRTGVPDDPVVPSGTVDDLDGPVVVEGNRQASGVLPRCRREVEPDRAVELGEVERVPAEVADRAVPGLVDDEVVAAREASEDVLVVTGAAVEDGVDLRVDHDAVVPGRGDDQDVRHGRAVDAELATRRFVLVRDERDVEARADGHDVVGAQPGADDQAAPRLPVVEPAKRGRPRVEGFRALRVGDGEDGLGVGILQRRPQGGPIWADEQGVLALLQGLVGRFVEEAQVRIVPDRVGRDANLVPGLAVDAWVEASVEGDEELDLEWP